MIWHHTLAQAAFMLAAAVFILVGMSKIGISLTRRDMHAHRKSDDPLVRITAVKRAALAQTHNTLSIRLCAFISGCYLFIPLHGWGYVVPALVLLATLQLFHRVEMHRLREIEAE